MIDNVSMYVCLWMHECVLYPSVYQCVHGFYISYEDSTQGLMIVQQARYGSSYLPSPNMIWTYSTQINLTLQLSLKAWAGAQRL